MKKSTLFFFFVVVIIVAVIARCNSRSRLAEERAQATMPTSPLVPSAAPSPTATATASPGPSAQTSGTPIIDAAKLATRIQPAVVSISVFEPSGKLLRTGTGLFVSSDGRILTTRSLMEGAAHAVAKTSDNRIHNVTGILADVAADDLALLKMEVKGQVPSVTPNTVATAEERDRIAVVQSPLGRQKVSVLDGTVSKKHRGANGEWLELSMILPSDAMGAPVIDGRGEVIGLVTRGTGESPVAVRTSATLTAVMARAPVEGEGKWFVQESSSAPPAEGPLRKIPLAQNPQGRTSKLVFSPPPAYPSTTRSSGPLKGTGRFRLTFGANGQVKNIMILRSTQNGALDQAAVDALRKWRAAPGEEWTLNVPITFQ